MQLFVVRHAIATELAPHGDDRLRPLAPKGIRRFRREIVGMRALGWTFSLVLHSPWRRAEETAQLLRPLLGRDGELRATAQLCSSPTTALLAELSPGGAATGPGGHLGGVAVVGHEPFLGELVGWLTAGDRHAGESMILRKGSVTWLEGSAVPGGMSLRALLPPRVLRALGKPPTP
jgi:phosphohistidine phosphatase